MDVVENPARARLQALLSRPVMPVAEAALAIAEEEYPGLRVDDYLGRLDALAVEVEARLPPRRDAASTLRMMRRVLFEEHGFAGNKVHYYDPRNSYLNEVIDRRVGIPITLSIVYMEVAARVGLHVQGVCFPGHFLVKHVSGGRHLYIDAYRKGELLDTDECIARYRAMTHGRELDPQSLGGASARQILGRLLHNLKRIYVEAGDDIRALWVIDRLLLLSPDDTLERRDRGLVEARLGGFSAAVTDLAAYLEATPQAADHGEVSQILAQLRTRETYLN